MTSNMTPGAEPEMPDTDYTTGWAETNALLAVMDQNHAGARVILQRMTSAEREELADALDEFDALVDSARADDERRHLEG